MSTDLRDQLQKLGLVTSSEVERHDKRLASTKKPASGRRSTTIKAGSRRSRSANVNRPSGLNGELKTLVSSDLPPKQQVMELVKHHACNDKRTTMQYFFSDSAGAVRSVAANKKQQQQLAEGVLAIVKPQQNRDPYVLVSAPVAKKIAELVPERVVLWHK